jgi:hypothetical protein
MKIATGTKQSQQDMAEKSQPQQRRHGRDSDDGEGRFKSKSQEILGLEKKNERNGLH